MIRPSASAHLVARKASSAFVLALVYFFAAAPLAAQSFKVQGGTSSVFQGHGGTLEVRGTNYTGRISLGLLGDGPRIGFYFARPMHGALWGFGDQNIPFVLPTDLFNNTYYFLGRGASMTRGDRTSSLFVYAGATSRGFSLPFFQAAQAQSPTGLVFYQRQLTPALKFYSFNIVSSRQTSIQSLEWTLREKMKLAASAGVGNNQRYFATSFDWANSWLDLQASVARAGNRFRRVSVDAPALSESDRENLRLELRPFSALRFVITRQNLLAARRDGEPFERAAVNGFGTFFRAGGYSLHGSLYSSRTRYGLSRASMLGVRRNFFQRIDASLDYLRSVPAAGEPTATYVATFREQVSPRWSFNQVVTRGPGQTSYAFGGFFFSNRLTAGVEYQTIFQPFSRAGEHAFRQVLLVTLKLQLPGGIELNAASDVSPAGKVRYTTYATTYAYRGVAPSGGGASIPSGAFYDYVVRGRVVDEAGQPVRGAALRLENDVVFTDSQGRFLHRVKKARELALAVALEDFMLPGRYVVLSAPASVKAAKEESAPLYDVVLRRVAMPAPKNVEKPAAPPRNRSDNRSAEEEIAKESVLGVPETKNGTPTTSGPFPLASSTQKNTMMDARPVVAGGAPEKRNGNAQAQPWVSSGVRHYRAADVPVRDGANAIPAQQQRERGTAFQGCPSQPVRAGCVDRQNSAQRAPAQRRPAAAGPASGNAAGESAGGRAAARKPVDLREWAERLRPRTPARPAGQ